MVGFLLYVAKKEKTVGAYRLKYLKEIEMNVGVA
jgi:hypothetical protein